ncbi:MAG: hypothetical protein SFX19_01710 [Alphaproteobacteria bacterium]|nr:hypothetical protein [Alphaproteobacteria bacterium]
MSYDLERIVLRDFFDSIDTIRPIDNSISDSKMIGVTQRKLKAALKDAPAKCTCAKRTWGGPCEVCQVSGNELYVLRNFFRVIRNAKKHDMPAEQMQEFIANTKKELN